MATPVTAGSWRCAGWCANASAPHRGVRIDDQADRRQAQDPSAGVEVVPIEQAVARYRAAVDMKNEARSDFVVMAQCYARDAAGAGWSIA